MYTKQERMMDEPILYKAYYTMAMYNAGWSNLVTKNQLQKTLRRPAVIEWYI